MIEEGEVTESKNARNKSTSASMHARISMASHGPVADYGRACLASGARAPPLSIGSSYISGNDA